MNQPYTPSPETSITKRLSPIDCVAIREGAAVERLVELMVERFAPAKLASMVVRKLHRKEVLDGIHKSAQHIFAIEPQLPPTLINTDAFNREPMFGIEADQETLMGQYRQRHEEKSAILSAAVVAHKADAVKFVTPENVKGQIRMMQFKVDRRSTGSW